MGKFKVGDRVRWGAHEDGGKVYVVEHVNDDGTFKVEGHSFEREIPGCYVLVEAAQATPTYTIEHVIPLIRDARQLDHATHIVCDRGGNTDLMEKMLRDVYAEIGEKVSRAVEVDA